MSPPRRSGSVLDPKTTTRRQTAPTSPQALCTAARIPSRSRGVRRMLATAVFMSCGGVAVVRRQPSQQCGGGNNSSIQPNYIRRYTNYRIVGCDQPVEKGDADVWLRAREQVYVFLVGVDPVTPFSGGFPENAQFDEDGNGFDRSRCAHAQEFGCQRERHDRA